MFTEGKMRLLWQGGIKFFQSEPALTARVRLGALCEVDLSEFLLGRGDGYELVELFLAVQNIVTHEYFHIVSPRSDEAPHVHGFALMDDESRVAAVQATGWGEEQWDARFWLYGQNQEEGGIRVAFSPLSDYPISCDGLGMLSELTYAATDHYAAFALHSVARGILEVVRGEAVDPNLLAHIRSTLRGEGQADVA
jgi:hypothetical protein